MGRKEVSYSRQWGQPDIVTSGYDWEGVKEDDDDDDEDEDDDEEVGL